MTTCLSAELQSSAQGMALVPRKPGVLLSVPLLSPNHSCLVRDVGNGIAWDPWGRMRDETHLAVGRGRVCLPITQH